MNFNLTFILWIVHLSGLYLDGLKNGYYISLHGNHSSWLDAVKTCENKARTLANYNQVTEAVKKCRNHTKEFGAIWTSNISIRTPDLSIVGCFKSSDGVFRMRKKCSSCKTIPICFYHCRKFAYFGISGNRCFCLSNVTEHENLWRQNATFCQKHTKSSEEDMIVYRRTNATFDYADQFDPFYNVVYNVYECRYDILNKLDMKAYLTTTNGSNKHFPVCRNSQINTNESTVSILRTALSDWKQANDACIRSTGDYLFDEILSSDTKKTCHALNAYLDISSFPMTDKFWSAQRTYMSPYSINEFLETNVSLMKIICTVANTSNIIMSIDQPCSKGGHGFFCVTDKPISSICHLEVKNAKYIFALNEIFAVIVLILIVGC